MIQLKNLNQLGDAINNVYKTLVEIKTENICQEQDMMAVYNKLDFLDACLKDLRAQFDGLRYTIHLHGAVSYHLKDRYYVYVSERYNTSIAPSLLALEDANGPWKDLKFAIKHWRRMMNNNEKNMKSNKIKSPIKYGILKYQAITGNLVEISLEEIEQQENLTGKSVA